MPWKIKEKKKYCYNGVFYTVPVIDKLAESLKGREAKNRFRHNDNQDIYDYAMTKLDKM